MSKIQLLESGVYVSSLAWELRKHEELWDQNRQRTQDPLSPHRDVQDIWARYAANPDERGPHESVWYPAARELGVPLLALVNWVCEKSKAGVLGGVLITRIPAGKRVYPHQDDGWHAREYEKVAVQIESAPGQKFCFDDEELETKPGDVYTFRNEYPHWVENPTRYERVTLIVCLKR